MFAEVFLLEYNSFQSNGRLNLLSNLLGAIDNHYLHL